MWKMILINFLTWLHRVVVMRKILQPPPQVSALQLSRVVLRFITGPQITSQSTTLLSPPQLTGEQHAYIPYKVAKETITKVKRKLKSIGCPNSSFNTLYLPAYRSVMR